MGLEIEPPAGATPLDPDDTRGLLPSHITNQQDLNEWEFENVARGEEWAFSTRHLEILAVDFMLSLHRQMFGDTWAWAGEVRRKEVAPVGVAPEHIRPALAALIEDVKEQLRHQTWDISEIAARFHHRLTAIHPFPNGNGRFARTMTDLLLVRADRPRFAWGSHLEKAGEARARYIAALQAADNGDYAPLFELLGVGPEMASAPDKR
jgi:Fic-DOC domain mobile mystery protein B